jgi:hypothetical protein
MERCRDARVGGSLNDSKEHTTMTRDPFRTSAAVALVAAFGLGTALPAVAQDTQGVTPADQSGGVPQQTLPDDDTILPGDSATGTAAAQPQQIIVMPDGSRVDAAEGQFLDLDDGTRVWEFGGVQYPIVTQPAPDTAEAPMAPAGQPGMDTLGADAEQPLDGEVATDGGAIDPAN